MNRFLTLHAWWLAVAQGGEILSLIPCMTDHTNTAAGDLMGMSGMTQGRQTATQPGPRAHLLSVSPTAMTPPPSEAYGKAADAQVFAMWRDLTAQIGEEIAHPLTAALERVQRLISTGKIDRDSLRALREELDRARRVGMSCQQIARLSRGRIKQSHERVQLHQLVQHVLSNRSRELQARGFAIRSVFKSAEVLVDPSLLFNVVNTMMDWSADHAAGEVDLRVDVNSWPRHARINMRFAPTRLLRTLVPQAEGLPATQLDDVSWHLLRQGVQAMALEMTRTDEDGKLSLTIEFPRTVDPESAQAPFQGSQSMEVDEGMSSNSKLLAGSHVLVVCTRREVRADIREALRDMGLVVDFVSSVDEAIEFCADALPHAIVVESIAAGAKFERFKLQLRTEVPEFPLVEIAETGPDFEISGMEGRDVGIVSRNAVREALGAALIFEMTKSM